MRIGKRKADLKFVIDVLLLFRPAIIRPADGFKTLNQYGVYKSYLKIAWRNLYKNKGYGFINIGGLALGMMVAMLIGLWIYDEFSFNKYHDNYSAVARVYRRQGNQGKVFTNMVQPTGLGTLLKSEYASNFKNVVLVRQRIEDRVLAFEDKKLSQKGYFMQPEGAEMFGLKMTKGSRDGLKDLKTIFLSESAAEKFFGEKDPIGQIMTMDAKWDLIVTGVYEDLPKNSEFNIASYFAPLDLYLDGWSNLEVWDNYNMNVYVQLRPGQKTEVVSDIIKGAMLSHVDAETAESSPEIFLLPMADWHLYGEFENGIQITSERMKFVRFFGIIAGFVLLLACINFMNLSTARSEKRAREVGIRKSIGSYRGQLIQQFIGESVLISFISLLFSLILVQLVLPAFNSIADKSISLPWSNYQFWLCTLGFSIFTGLLAGSYPALYLSSFNPIRVLKGTFRMGRSASTPRRALVIIQFTFSISLIVATIIVYQQIEFAKNRPVGYNRSSLITLHPRSPEYNGKFKTLQNELKKTGAVREIAAANYPFNSTLGWNGDFEWNGMTSDNSDIAFNINEVTPEYGRTLGWKFLQGRDFSSEMSTDASGVIINESAARLMGLSNPVGEVLTKNREGEPRANYTILGVIADVVKGSPFEPTDQCLYFLSTNDLDWLFIRLDPSVSAHDALPKIQKVFTQYIPSAPFDYTFADDEYAARFRAEEREGSLAAIFSSFAILISCSGLFGLAAFVAEQRTKEIGIRKVMGASVVQVWKLLSFEFVFLVTISCFIAIPLSYYYMQDWLAQYEYRTTIKWYVFAVAGFSALLITLMTVSVQAVKAAVVNPVKSLRSE